MARPKNKIAKYRDFLKERMDPDKILDWLLAKAILSKEEVDEVKSRSTISKKNQKLLEYIAEKDEGDEFINALRDANQQHLANYLLNDGIRSQNKPEDWPLTEEQIKIIDVNCGSLKDLIETEDLVDRLVAKSVINHRQKQLICSKAIDSEKNEAFLDILRRRSLSDYDNAIQCLRDSNQNHVAEILEEGGAVLQVHAKVSEPSDEVRIAERITDLLQNRTIEESDRILEMARYKLIRASTGHSIIFYFYCKTLQSWHELKKAIKSGHLKGIIEQLCRRADPQTNVIIETIQVHDHDMKNVDMYFDYKGKRRSTFAKTFAFLLAIVFLNFGVAIFYARLTMPCWTKHLDCKMAKEKIDVIREVHDRFTFKFKQLENSTSEMLQTVKESPNKDDLISLILELYETPNEETRKKIAERIRELEEELINKGTKKQRQAIKNLMENVIKIIGKVSFRITIDVFQMAEDLINLVNGILTPKEQPEESVEEEPVGEELVIPVTIHFRFQFQFLRRVFVRPQYPALPGPPETDEQEAYEEALKEKLKAIGNLTEETVLILIEFIDEAEGVNDLLKKILENFHKERQQVCSETPHIKESKTRGYPELRTGMLRLTCLLDETVRMTRLLNELHKQAISLKEDVERMVEEVNEFAKQSIPSLLATLLTVTLKQEKSNKGMQPW